MGDKFRHGRAGTKKFFAKHGRHRDDRRDRKFDDRHDERRHGRYEIEYEEEEYYG